MGVCKGFRMIRVFFQILLILVSAKAQSGFLTEQEHGEKIYYDTRAIACVSCHGPRGEGAIIAVYPHKDANQTLFAPPIAGFTQAALKTGVAKHKNGPNYYLSDEAYAGLAAYLERK